MSKQSDDSGRDPKDDARAREWVEEASRRGEAGKLGDDSGYLAWKLAGEKRKPKGS